MRSIVELRAYMRFLISCYKGGGGSGDTTEEITTGTLPRRERIVPLNNINYHETPSTKKTRRRLKRLHSASWKPVLSAISENGSEARFSNQRVAISTESSVKIKSGSPSSCESKHRKSVDPSSFPVFSPAPFMF